ncbi:hypothetical protein JRQ81_002720, partial [Phrynocephalus forsythii]
RRVRGPGLESERAAPAFPSPAGRSRAPVESAHTHTPVALDPKTSTSNTG